MVDYLCIIQARMNSSRLPAKVMLDLGGKTLLERVYETVSKSKRIDIIVVATSNKLSDDIIEFKLNSINIPCFRGDLDNVLKRFYDTSNQYPCKNIIRITADNPLMDANIIDILIENYENDGVNYSMFKNGIYGLSAEVFSKETLDKAYLNARNNFDREHVTPYIKENFLTKIYIMPYPYNQPQLSVSIDTLEDYIKMQKFYLKYSQYNIDTFLENNSNEN